MKSNEEGKCSHTSWNFVHVPVFSSGCGCVAAQTRAAGGRLGKWSTLRWPTLLFQVLCLCVFVLYLLVPVRSVKVEVNLGYCNPKPWKMQRNQSGSHQMLWPYGKRLRFPSVPQGNARLLCFAMAGFAVAGWAIDACEEDFCRLQPDLWKSRVAV